MGRVLWAARPNGTPLRRSAAAAQSATGEHAGVLALIDHELAIGNDVLDTDWKLLRIASRGRCSDVLGMKDDDVRLHAVAQHASIRQAKALGRKRGHLADGIRERHGALVAHVLRQNERETAVRPRAGEVA